MSTQADRLKTEVITQTDKYAILYMDIVTDLSPDDMTAVALTALEVANQLKTKSPHLELYAVVKATIDKFAWSKLRNIVLPHQVSQEYIKTFAAIYTIAEDPLVRFAYNSLVGILKHKDKFYTVKSLDEAKEKISQIYSSQP